MSPVTSTPGTEALPRWSVKSADVPKIGATGVGGVVTYQDFAKYRLRLEMYLGTVGVAIEDFDEGGRFGRATAEPGTSDQDHKAYVRAFLSVINKGFEDQPRVCSRLGRVVTQYAGEESKACYAWSIIKATYDNPEARRVELMNVTDEWGTHVSRGGVAPEDSAAFETWSRRAVSLYEAMCGLKEITDADEALMARQVAAVFGDHGIVRVAMLANATVQKPDNATGLNVHDVLQQLGAKLLESQSTAKAAQTVLVAKASDDLKSQIDRLETALAALIKNGNGNGAGGGGQRERRDRSQFTPGNTKKWCEACGVVDLGHHCSTPKTLECAKCKKQGHKRWACSEFPAAVAAKEKQKVFDERRTNASSSSYCSSEEAETQPQQLLAVDSGCTMSVVLEAAQLAVRHQRTTLVRGVGGTRRAEATGQISLSSAGHTFPPLEALVLSEAPAALLSVSGLVEQGYQVVFSGQRSRIETPSGRSLPLERRDGLFFIRGTLGTVAPKPSATDSRSAAVAAAAVSAEGEEVSEEKVAQEVLEQTATVETAEQSAQDDGGAEQNAEIGPAPTDAATGRADAATGRADVATGRAVRVSGLDRVLRQLQGSSGVQDGPDCLPRAERRRAGRTFPEDLRRSDGTLSTMGAHSKWPGAVALKQAAGSAQATVSEQMAAEDVDEQQTAVDAEDEAEQETSAAQRLRRAATSSTNRFEILGEEYEEDMDEVESKRVEGDIARTERDTTAAQAKQATRNPRGRKVTKLMLHRLAGHVGGAAGIRHVRALDPTLELEEVAADHSEPACGACAFAKMKRAPVGSGPHAPWGERPGDGVALDWVEKTKSRRGNTCALLFTDAVSGYIMPTFHVTKTSESAVVGLKEWVAAAYKTAAPQGVWILLDRDSTFLGDRLQPSSNTVFYNYVTQQLGWRPHFAAGDEHATHGIAESTVQKVANTTAALLHDCRLGPAFWDDAMAHACHMLNIMPRSRKPASAALERDDGRRPLVDRTDPPVLARFGCLVAFRIPTAERVGDKAKTSFGRKAELGIFLGWARDATFGSARVLSLSTGRVRVSRSLVLWDSITPEARCTPCYIKELENQVRQLGAVAPVEYEAVETEPPEPSADSLPTHTKEVVVVKEVVSAASKLGQVKEVRNTPSSATWGKRWDSHARRLDELLKEPEVQQQSQIEQVMAAVQRATREDIMKELVMAALDEETATRPPSGHVYDNPMRPAATPKHMKALAQLSEQDQRLWRAALKEELDGLHANQALVEVRFEDIPRGQRAMSCLILFQKKDPDEEGRVRCKVRVVVRGCEQAREESDNRWNAPTVATALLKMVAIKAVSEGKQVLAADIKQAFLKSEIDTDVEQIYIKLQDDQGQMRYYMLAKGLYGLRSSPGRWFARFSADLRAYGFRSFPYNPCLWTDGTTTLAVHVDDSMIVSTGPGCQDLISYLRRCYGPDSVNIKPMSDVDAHFLGQTWHFNTADKTVTIKQTASIDRLLDSTDMTDCNGVDTPAVANGHLAAQEEEGRDPRHNAVVGQLLWLLQSRPDIGYSVKELCRHNNRNGEEHAAYRKRIIRYLKRTRDQGLVLRGGQDLQLAVWSDSGWAECKDTRRCTSGLVVTLGSSVIYSKSYTQPTIATSSCEAELYAQFEAAHYIQHFRWAAQFLELEQRGSTALYTDSQSAMKLLRRPEPGARSKHLDMRYFKIKELIDRNVVHLVHEGTDTMVADILTKPLGPEKFRQHADRMLQGQVYPLGGAGMTEQEESKTEDEMDNQEL